MINKKIHLYLWIFTLGTAIILILPRLLKDGMFLDGVLYSAISHNFARGYSDFWHPHFGKVIYSFFDQQPPLFFAIQGYFFKIFGSNMYVERLYSFLFCILNIIAICVLWNIIFKYNSDLKQYSWLPVFLWIIIPVVNWGFSNNIIENTMSFFCLVSVILSLLAFNSKNLYSTYLYLLFSGVFIFLASLTKGIQGTFVLTFPFILALTDKQFNLKKGIFYSTILLFIPTLIYFFLLQDKEIYKSLSTYLHNRVINSIKNVSTVENRFYLLYRLFTELLPSIIISIIILAASYIRKKNIVLLKFKKETLAFLLVGLAGSLPLMITKEQRGFYLNTSFPYFSIAISLFIVSEIEYLFKLLTNNLTIIRLVKIVSVVIFIVGIYLSINSIGKFGRDKDLLNDVYTLGKIIPRGDIICVSPKIVTDWTFQSYMIRHYYISIDPKVDNSCKFLLIKKDEKINLPETYQKINVPLKKFTLLKSNK